MKLIISKSILLLIKIAAISSCSANENIVKEQAVADTASRHKTIFTSKENSRVSIDSLYNYSFDATDSSGKALSYAAINLPAWLQYNEATHSISGKPVKAGQYPVHLTATNGKDTAHQYFMLTVYNKQTQNILCLGNSITNGTATYNSYRRALWQLLHAGNYNVDLIGSWSKHHMGGDVPNPDFDMDHDGHSGWTAQDVFTPPDWDSIRGNINVWLQIYTPHIVLIELGTNDVFQCRKASEVMNNFTALITLLRNNNPGVKILIAQIPPLGTQWADKKLCGTASTYAQDIEAFNKAVAVFVSQHNNTQSPVVIVDQFIGVHPATDMYDDIHPNDKGEKEMAERWFKALKPWITKL